VVGRAALGLFFIELPPDALATVWAELPSQSHPVLLDAPLRARTSERVWGRAPDPRLLELMLDLKARFDPARVCNPGIFVGGI
jgi:hypothetical protein